MNVESLFSELGVRWGLHLQSEQGAIKLVDNDNQDWYLECPPESPYLTIHTALLPKPIREEELAIWLTLNTDRTLMGNSWVGVNEEHLILGTTVPVEFIDVNLVENMMNNLYEQASNLKQRSEVPINTEREENRVFYTGSFA